MLGIFETFFLIHSQKILLIDKAKKDKIYFSCPHPTLACIIYKVTQINIVFGSIVWCQPAANEAANHVWKKKLFLPYPIFQSYTSLCIVQNAKQRNYVTIDFFLITTCSLVCMNNHWLTTLLIDFITTKILTEVLLNYAATLSTLFCNLKLRSVWNGLAQRTMNFFHNQLSVAMSNKLRQCKEREVF